MIYEYDSDPESLREAIEWVGYVGTYVTCGRFHRKSLETAIQEVRMLK